MPGFKLGRGLVAALLLVSFIPAVHADDEEAAAPTRLETVVVTGSAIPSRDIASEHPITVITAEEIRRSGAVSLQQFLRTIPAVGFQGFNNNQTTGQLTGSGNNFIDLRNLGPARTLVLIDGKRYTPSSNQTSEAVDIGNIPVSLIDHVEILRDGASPIYGSDAIGGVINVILRKRFEGLEVGAQFGTSTRLDGNQELLSVLYGTRLGPGHLVLDLEFNKSDPILQRDRGWAHNAFLPGITLGTLQVSRSPLGLSSAKGTSCPTTGISSDCVATGAGTSPGYRPATVADFYDLSANNYLTIGQERFSGNALFDAPLMDDVSFYSEALFTYRRSDGQGSPAGFKNSTTSRKYPTSQKVAAGAEGNPYGVGVSLSEQFPEYGPTQSHGQDPAFRLMAGFRGKLLSRFDWDLSWFYGEDNDNLTGTNKINFTHALEELGDPRAPDCAASPGCVPGNFFVANSLSQAAADYLLYDGKMRSRYAEASLDGTISGRLPGLPAGNIRVALGGDYRRLRGSFTPDAVTLAGDQNGPDTASTNGAYDLREAFFELKAPLLRDLPAIDEFEIDGATRYSNYSNFGDAITWKLGIDWRVTPDLRLRGGHTTGFRAPGITELYLGQTSISPAIVDPCNTAQSGLTGSNPTVAANCAAAGVPSGYSNPSNNFPTYLAGNPGLQPETSQSWSAGLVLTPRFAPALSLTVDWYDIYIRNAIGRLDPNYILDQCYESANLSSPYCGEIAPRTGAASGAPGQLTNITDIEGNLGGIKTDGLDVVLHYELPLRGLPGHNVLAFDNFGTWTFSYEQQTGVGSPYSQFAGTLDLPTSPTNAGLIAHFRDKATLDLRHDNLDLSWTVQYLGSGNAVTPTVAPGFTGPASAYPGNHVPAIVYHSLALSWSRGPAILTFGVNNVFDKDPPFWNDGTVNTNEFTYDTVGRFFYLNLKASFAGVPRPH